MGQAQAAVLGLAQPRIAVIGAQRIAAGGHEIHHRIEILAREWAIGRGDAHFGKQRIGIERRRAGRAQHMLRQHVERARLQPLAVEFAGQHRIARGIAFQHLEAVGRHQQRGAGFVQPVIGAADALDQPGRALGRADADHLVHRAPVDAEVQGGGADHRAQIARAPWPLPPCAAAPAPACRDAARWGDCRR